MKSEQELIDETVHRLAGKFSQLSVGLIATVVEDAYKHFDECLIRDYIPLLVQRRADSALALFAADLDLTPELAPTA